MNTNQLSRVVSGDNFIMGYFFDNEGYAPAYNLVFNITATFIL